VIISVINHSEYTDEFVQEVLRAINRQIAEDFEPYWHRAGELRLEGAVGRRPNPRNPQELRGDAILYLWDEVDQREALGYHDLNYRGIPFGIVFTQLSEETGEDWTVTLSHEALELITDPEANLLAQGPHPDDPERRIYHWYEVCDAVQAQSYEIDGVAVSNFVLPLYFTESDEKGSRNDFLGEESDDGPLPSFGVAPGGYIGFFDPETQEHDQYVSPRGEARERLAARLRAGWARRAVRRQRETSPEPVLRRILQRNPDDPLPGPWFEGFAVDVRAREGEDPYDLLDAAARTALGDDWERRWLAVEPSRRADDSGPTPYELVPQDIELSIGRVWEHCYTLREQPGVVDVEPDFVFFRPDSEAISDLPARRGWALFGWGHLKRTDEDYEWSLDQIRARQAWALARGERVMIGHPDTGYLPHPEIWPEAGSGPIDTARDWDFVTDEDDARAEPEEDDPLPGGPNHGTSTASVIVSAAGPADGDRDKPWVSGVAPKAALVPLRVSNSVVHFCMRRVRKAIEYATAQGLHVVSMGLGGPFPSRHLRAAIRQAERSGVILVGASGNYIPFRPVVWPARYPEVIAVAACNAEEKPWFGSSRGGAVDITAPGESVWRASVDDDAEAGDRYRVERSSGTSYAASHVAGVCALWLSYHGWHSLYSRYGERLTDAFRHLLRETARSSEHLDEEEFGPGIVDAEAVLLAPLPSRETVVRASARGRGRRARAADDGALESIRALFPHLARADVRRGLEGLFDTDARGLARKLREVGDELAFQFACDPRLCRRFSAHCCRGARMRATGAVARRWRAISQADLRGRLRRTGSSRLASSLE
jgi:subtilisin family serine protease